MSQPVSKLVTKPGPTPTPIAVQKKRVLEAAMRIFEPEHPSRFRVQDLVSAAGMSTKTFYEIYGSRDAVILELASRLCTDLIDELELVVASTKSPTSRIDRGLAVVVKAVTSTPLFVRGLSEEAEAGLEKEINRFLDAAIDIMDQAAREAYESGILSRMPVRLESEVLIGGAARVVVMAIRTEGHDLNEIQAGLGEILTRHFS